MLREDVMSKSFIYMIHPELSRRGVHPSYPFFCGSVYRAVQGRVCGTSRVGEGLAPSPTRICHILHIAIKRRVPRFRNFSNVRDDSYLRDSASYSLRGSSY